MRRVVAVERRTSVGRVGHVGLSYRGLRLPLCVSSYIKSISAGQSVMAKNAETSKTAEAVGHVLHVLHLFHREAPCGNYDIGTVR